MAQLSSKDVVVATLLVDDIKGDIVNILPGIQESPFWISAFITEAQVLTLNSFIKQRWEKALQEAKVPYTSPPHPPKPDQEF